MQTNPLFRSLNRPLTILGAERKLFFFALIMGACVFNLFSTLLGALVMFFALYLFARWATRMSATRGKRHETVSKRALNFIRFVI